MQSLSHSTSPGKPDQPMMAKMEKDECYDVKMRNEIPNVCKE
jgi:hypothetical protein